MPEDSTTTRMGALLRRTSIRQISALLLLTTITAGAALPAAAQTVVSGQITSDGKPVAFANVGVLGTTYGAAANDRGRYRLEGLPPGTYVLAVSAVGYATAEHTITLESGRHVTLDVELSERVIENEGIVVTGTLRETFVRDSPVKVDVVSTSFLQKTPTFNVMDAIDRVNGLRQQIDCGVCGTNNIRIHGMDGPYTVVLIDGMPIMSSLATVYGLNGISPALISQVEVIKGPMSTLYGTEALAGVINIITKSPQTSPRLSASTFVTNHGEYAADFGVVPSRGDVSGFLSGTVAYNDRVVDENGDGFSDLTLNRRVSLFGKLATVDAEGRPRLSLSGRYYDEDRLGGTRAFLDRFTDALRGSDEYYGEAIRTHRAELMGTYSVVPDRSVRLDFAANDHVQDSFYGDQYYRARQATVFGQLTWHGRIDDRQSLLAGAGARWQQYDDNTGSTGAFDDQGTLLANRPDRRLIPGVFVQHEAAFSGDVRLLSGLRVDHQSGYGPIVSPRLSLKASLHDRTTLRANAGTGFRIVNLFTEDHAAYTGARATVIMEDLRPERSYSGTLSLQQILPFGGHPLTIDLDAFYTRFTNKIEPDYSVPGEIRYANLDGFAVTRGLALGISQSFWSLPVSYTAGVTAMDVFREEHGGRAPIEFAPDYSGSLTLTLSPTHDWAVDYTATLTGPMKLPEFPEPFSRRPWSPVYTVHALQATHTIHLDGFGELQVYGAVENLLNYIQPSPLIDPANPFGEHFDTIYVYGPLHGRSVGLGVRVMMAE